VDSKRRLERGGAIAGIAGPLLLAAYFAAPAIGGWPFAGTTPAALIAYASAHELLFYAGGWLQATGALLSSLFFIVLIQVCGARDRLEGALVMIGVAVLLSVVLVEAALLEAVPIAAASGDTATVATTFALSNGVFSRIFPLAPAPLIFAGIGFALRRGDVIPGLFGTAALVIPVLFVVAGVAAVFGPPGLILAIVMSVIEAGWILSAAVAFARRSWRV
jgi:hypothetical protein